MEIWKDIKGYETKYQISTQRRIKIKEREYITSNGVKRKIRERIKTANSKGTIVLENHPYNIDSLYMENFPLLYTEEFKNKTTLDGEIWADIDNYEGLYQVSNFGRVRSLPRFGNNQIVSSSRDGNSMTYTRSIAVKGRILKPLKVGIPDRVANYRLGVTLIKDSTPKSVLINRLVAQAFIPNPDNLSEVNHKNRDITNNTVDNLEWVSTESNINHAQLDRKVLIALYDLAYSKNKTPSEMLLELINGVK